MTGPIRVNPRALLEQLGMKHALHIDITKLVGYVSRISRDQYMKKDSLKMKPT